jgi:alkylated DNA repair dioxygenase AlkB
MNTLFPEEQHFPDGFLYFPGFLSKEEEEGLVQEILMIDLHPMIFQGFEAKRKTKSFGFDYSFDHRRLSKGKDIPDAFHFLMEKVAGRISIAADEFKELLVTEYPAGAVINWHRDAPPFDLIAGVSFLTDCNFRLRPHDKSLQNRKSIISFTVEPRSLYIMQGPARTDWQHSIHPVKQTRYSITLRTLKKN